MQNADSIREKLKPMFASFNDSMMFSYFDGILGYALCDNAEKPHTAVIIAGDFYFVAGQIDSTCAREIMEIVSENRWGTIIPDKKEWADELSKYGKKMIVLNRYHTRLPEKSFDIAELEKRIEVIESKCDYKLNKIDEALYKQSLENEWSSAFVSNFRGYNDYEANGFGFVITKNGRIVSGTSTYSYYNKGVEIEVATDEKFRLNGLATICAAAFLKECINRKLKPHWDARNLNSLAIAKKMGFEFSDSYTAMEFDQNCFEQ